MSLEEKARGSIVIKYIDIRLYLCSDCYHYFRESEAGMGGVNTEFGTENYDTCPKCDSSNIVLNCFQLKVTKLEEVK